MRDFRSQDIVGCSIIFSESYGLVFHPRFDVSLYTTTNFSCSSDSDVSSCHKKYIVQVSFYCSFSCELYQCIFLVILLFSLGILGIPVMLIDYQILFMKPLDGPVLFHLLFDLRQFEICLENSLSLPLEVISSYYFGWNIYYYECFRTGYVYFCSI